MRIGLFGKGGSRAFSDPPSVPSTKAGKARDAGDRARDLSDWSQAAQRYAEYLASAPDDFAIWVQLGNCRKELGDYPGALGAYDSAIRLDDLDPDVHLQKGHALKLAGRIPDAIAAYRRSVELRSDRNPALLELAVLAPEEIADLPNAELLESDVRTVYVDITDLVEYLSANTTLSGIQRVVANLLVYSRDYCRTEGNTTANFVIPDYPTDKVFAVGTGLVQALVETVAAGNPDRSTLDKLLDAIKRSKRPAQPQPGDVVILPGAFWIYRHYELLDRLRSAGVYIAVFIHDLIQVRNPEYVEKGASDVFRYCFHDVVAVADKIITSSNFVAGEVRDYIEEKFNFSAEIDVVPLATELNGPQRSAAGAGEEFSHLLDNGYVLCVATIEIRKNHEYLISIWEKLIGEFDGRIPNLVFVGKWGWYIDELRKYIEESDYLDARLFIYNNVSDSGLTWLYQHCLFTIYPSFAEGWGLPITESLAFGKPCIASNTTSMPEVGGPLCKYFDPFDVEDGYRVVNRVLSDPAALVEWTSTVRTTFKPRTWRNFSEEVYRTVVAGAKALTPGPRETKCLIETATVAPVGAAALAELDARNAKQMTARMSRAWGWRKLEFWGCWASQRRAVLRFRTRLGPGSECCVYLHLRAPEEANLAECVVKSGDLVTRLDNVGSTPGWRTARCIVGDRGVVELALMSGKGFKRSAERGEYIGIIAIAIAPLEDQDARRKIVSQIVPER